MSISVEDLVSSFSSNHISQEALDIAALHAQLAQTLISQSTSPSPNEQDLARGSSRPCNTPTAGCTSTPTFNWHHPPGDEADEDERIVEDLLLPPSPASPIPSSTQPFSLSHQPPYTFSRHHPAPTASYFCAAEASTSLFTSTDPFYIEQLRAAQNYYSSPPSFLAQPGRPTHASPFLIHHHHHQHPHYQLPHCEGHGYISGAAISVGTQSHS